MRASAAWFWPCSASMLPVVLCADAHAVTPIEQAATTIVPTRRRARSPKRLRGSVLDRAAIGHLVTDAVHRADVCRVPRVTFDLLAQLGHVHVDGSFGDVAVQAGGLLDELSAAEHLVR